VSIASQHVNQPTPQLPPALVQPIVTLAESFRKVGLVPSADHRASVIAQGACFVQAAGVSQAAAPAVAAAVIVGDTPSGPLSDIDFRVGMSIARSLPHELAHVVQQRLQAAG
jgi:hypothetical protein